MQRRICLTSTLFLTVASMPFAARAGDFRVETDVFVGDDEKAPVVETLTIFQGDVVFDFLRSGVEEITVFDHARDRLVLMDTRRRVKTQLSKTSILSVMAEMQAKLQDEGADREYLLADHMKLDTVNDHEIVLANDRLSYRSKGIDAKDEDAARRYQEFANWYARLNAMRPGNPPPFARIRLNGELAARKLIPEWVERSLIRRQGLHEVRDSARSRHLITWRLSQTDRKSVDRASSYLATFRSIPFSEYVGLK